eukprot:6622006-Pyramimonas_sp.AAC.1
MLGEVLVGGGQECDAESKAMKARQAAGETVDFKARGGPHIRLFCRRSTGRSRGRGRRGRA